MNAWLQFLTQHGAQFDESGAPAVTGFANGGAPAATAFVTPLTELGLIAVSGDDAASFLHNQLTNDVEHLGMKEARLAGYCSPKGRMLAAFLMWRTAEAVMLQLPREIQPAVQKRLQMFVLRAKAKLADVSDKEIALGLAGEAAAKALSAWFPALPAAPYAKVDSQAGTLIRVADAYGVPRYQWIASVDTAQQAWPELIKTLPPAPASLWRLGDIHAGIPRIVKTTQEQFVPQMVNFELIGGVNFRKGCYPGQEIVARSQYLGKQKRRMLPASIAASGAVPGAEVYASGDPEQPCGMIVSAEPNQAGGMDCLVEIKTAALSDGSVHLGSAQGPALRFRTLPYALPE